MTWTYDPTLATDLAKVRFAIGDTDTAAQMFSDEEIEATLLIQGSVLASAIALAESLGARYSRMSSITIDGASFDYGSLGEMFFALADRLGAQLGSGVGAIGAPILTGVSRDAMRSVDADSDRPASSFRVGMNDDLGLGALDPEPI